VANCPLNDPSRMNDLLPVLLDKCCAKADVELTPRVNVNTAPREVLAGLPGLADTDVDAIMSAREGLSPDAAATSTSAAWLVTMAGVTPAKFKALESYVTGSSMVYRIESIGYLGGGSPVVRVEAIVDINLGSPRILYFRELSALDNPRAYQPPPVQQ
jgi:hypothetical protein